MLGEESKIDANKYNSEVDFCSGAVEGVSWEQGESVDECCNNGKYCSYREDVVEVGNYVVCVKENNV